MSHDRHLFDTIKQHLSRKSSAQLQEMVQTNNQERWSPEAIAAAGEILQDRMAGSAQEPGVAEEDSSPLPSPRFPYSLGFILGFLPVFVLNGFRFGSEHAAADQDNLDLPVPFGPKMAWLALDTTDTEAVATALSLQGARAATWAEGIAAAYQSLVFVTPPVADWTLAVSTSLFPPEQAEAFVKPFLERLSHQLGEAQYFCTHRDAELHVWARARQGRLVRGYGWLGEKSLTLWDEGATTKEERELGVRFFGGQSPMVEQGQNKDLSLPDEGCVMQLASRWSVDPTTLDELLKEPVMGLLGNVPWAGNRAGR